MMRLCDVPMTCSSVNFVLITMYKFIKKEHAFYKYILKKKTYSELFTFDSDRQ